jgi:hypothetical protein
MRNTVVSALGTLLVALSAFCATTASARTVQQTGEQFRRHDITTLREFRRSYNKDELNVENFGIGGRDPSRVGGWDPSLNPSGS